MKYLDVFLALYLFSFGKGFFSVCGRREVKRPSLIGFSGVSEKNFGHLVSIDSSLFIGRVHRVRTSAAARV